MSILASLRRRARWLAVWFLLPASARMAPPPELPLDVFFGDEQVRSLRISPTGRYLAMLQPANHRMNITVIDREKGTKKRLTDMKEENVVDVFWLNDDRLGFRQQHQGQESFGIYAVNADGSKLAVLQQLVAFDGDKLVNAPPKQFTIVDMLPDDPKRMLVDVFRGRSGLGDLHYLDIYTEKFSKVMTNPGKVRRWLTDRAGVVRLGFSQDEGSDSIEVIYRSSENSPWTTLLTKSQETLWEPLGFDGDNRTLFIRATENRPTAAIYTYDPETREITAKVFADDTYDAGGIIYDRARKKVVGVTYDGEKPGVFWLDPARRKLAADIDATFPGMRNQIVSATRDQSLVIIHSGNDRDPGTYYLLNTVRMELSELMRPLPKVNSGQMAEMLPIKFAARDGLLLHGYLTLPAGREPKALPLLIHPHGGPFGIRDSWGFNNEVQFLANRGYAVLQVNYRGSGGYGSAFEEAGYRQWGLKMQDDLTDAVHWAVAQGFADPTRVGIYGASYGGYATLAGLVYTPELYKVGINYVGVADIDRLGLMTSFRNASKSRQVFVAKRWLNPDKDQEQIKATSPINFVANIRVPSLHAYGRNDPRVTVDHGEVLRDRLTKAGKDFEFHIEDTEGHGFNRFENRLGFYARMETFLKKHLPATGE